MFLSSSAGLNAIETMFVEVRYSFFYYMYILSYILLSHDELYLNYKYQANLFRTTAGERVQRYSLYTQM